MAHDIRATHTTGRTLTAKLFTAGAQVGPLISLTETSQAGYYTGSVPSGTAMGIYDVLLFEGAALLDSRPLRWDGLAEEAVVVPGPPAETDLCRVYGYVEGADNVKLANVTVVMSLMPEKSAIASERLVAGRNVTLKTDAQGRLVGPTGDPWVDLQRNDRLTPLGTYYEVTSDGLGVYRKKVTLTSDITDLRTLLLAP